MYPSVMITHTIGAVLAGGSSTRMGSDKSMLEYMDAPLIDHIVATMSLALDEVVVCGGDYHGPLDVLADPVADAGPLAGLLAALVHAAGKPVVIVPTDMPLITVDLIHRLADPRVTGTGARVAKAGDQIQPLCAAYGPGVRAVAAELLEGSHRSVMGLVDTLDPVVYIKADPRTLTNINTPEDYSALTEAWGQ